MSKMETITATTWAASAGVPDQTPVTALTVTQVAHLYAHFRQREDAACSVASTDDGMDKFVAEDAKDHLADGADAIRSLFSLVRPNDIAEAALLLVNATHDLDMMWDGVPEGVDFSTRRDYRAVKRAIYLVLDYLKGTSTVSPNDLIPQFENPELSPVARMKRFGSLIQQAGGAE